MKKDHWLLLLFCLSMFLYSAGQNNIAQQMNEKDYQFNNNISSIEQIGSDNTASVSQNGYDNLNHIRQTGSKINTHLQQTNSTNKAILNSVGGDIKVTAIQTGDANHINTHIQNHDLQTRSAELTQQGNFTILNCSLQERL